MRWAMRSLARLSSSLACSRARNTSRFFSIVRTRVSTSSYWNGFMMRSSAPVSSKMAERRVSARPAQTVDFGHHLVDQDEIGRVLAGDIERLAAVARAAHVVVLGGQPLAQQAEVVLPVVRDQDLVVIAVTHVSPSASSGMSARR